MGKNRKKTMTVGLLWAGFLLLVAAVAYLSFQNGAAAKLLGRDVIASIAEQSQGDFDTLKGEFGTLTGADAVAYLIRQGGRIGAFFMIGILGTVSVYVTFKRCHWVVRAGIILPVLVGIAYLTEKLKIYIPGRHYSYEEMLLSITAVLAGFLLVSAVFLLGSLVKAVRRPKTAG